MIAVTVMKNKNRFKSLECKGHAEFAEYGKDIVCASVSVLVINTINSIEKLTDTKTQLKADETTGFIRMDFTSDVSEEATLLMNSLIIGLRGIQNDYGKKYLDFNIKEV